MRLGYDQPMYLLPFDHRPSYVTGIFHVDGPLTHDQRDAITDSKELIYEGFRQALGHGVTAANAGIVVGEEFAADILRDATRNGYLTALSIERSGSAEFEFEHGEEFASHIAALRPTFASVSVRFNPEGDVELNRRQTARLKRLSEHCHAVRQRFMFELLVPPTAAQLAQAQRFRTPVELLIRPALMLQAIGALQDAGIEPDVWKIQGLERRSDCEHIVSTVRRNGRSNVGCMVVGHDAGEEQVTHWLETAASVPGFIGFAVGHTTFWRAVAAFAAKQVTRAEAVSLVARRYREWVRAFERARASRVKTA